MHNGNEGEKKGQNIEEMAKIFPNLMKNINYTSKRLNDLQNKLKRDSH